MPIILKSSGVYFPETSISTAALMAQEHPTLLMKRRRLNIFPCEAVRVASIQDTQTSMAADAACSALESADWGSEDLQLLMTVGCTLPDVDIWSSSAKVAQLLDAMQVECLGVGDAACAGSYVALRVVAMMMRSEVELRRSVICAACIMPGDRVFFPSTVFGDGAGAFVLEKVERAPKAVLQLKQVRVRTFPQFADAFGPAAGLLRLRKEGCLRPEDWSFDVRDAESFRELARVNYDLGAELLRDALEKQGWLPESVTRLIADNVTKNIGQVLAEKTKIPFERVSLCGRRERGHAFTADMFSNVHFSLEERPLERRERVVSIGMGVGQHWGLALWES